MLVLCASTSVYKMQRRRRNIAKAGAGKLRHATKLRSPRRAVDDAPDRLCRVCTKVIQFVHAPYGMVGGFRRDAFCSYLFTRDQTKTDEVIQWESLPINTVSGKPTWPLCRLCLEVLRRSNLQPSLAAPTRFFLTPHNYQGSIPCHIGLHMEGAEQSRYRIPQYLVPLADGDTRPTFSARRLGFNRSIFGTAEEWIKGCERHGNGCDALIIPQKPRRTHELSNFRLIDAQDMCIVTASTLWKYFALSYVWGPANSNLKATISNISILEQPGSQKKYWDDIPLTIRDAITVVSKLYHRYLWVDSMCTIQYDEEIKENLIKEMHLV